RGAPRLMQSEAKAELRPVSGAHRTERLPKRLSRYVLSFLVLPDHQRGWIVPAIFAAIRNMRRRGIGWMMTSCPPYSVHVVGLAVSTLTRRKWIVDFRDPWMTTGTKRLYPTSALSLKIEKWLERKVIERADLVVFNVERLRDAYRERYRNVPRERSEEHTSELQSRGHLVCRLLLEKK